MSTQAEKIRSIELTAELLTRLAYDKPLDVSTKIRHEAQMCLRHLPTPIDIRPEVCSNCGESWEPWEEDGKVSCANCGAELIEKQP